ncbi:thioredoxin domain-containing protein [Actibacterium mucosum]|nr:hypothetical protein [Actibacterium mucosum]
MKKKRSTPKRKKQADDMARAATQAQQESRRRFLRLLRTGAIAVPIVGIGGLFSVRAVQATIHENDLTRVGQGVPAIVQVHDPQCPLCQQLQRQTRKAMRGFEEDEGIFLVANIASAEGSAFAARYGAPHVTLLLFDARGRMQQVVRGPVQDDDLRAIISEHLD